MGDDLRVVRPGSGGEEKHNLEVMLWRLNALEEDRKARDADFEARLRKVERSVWTMTAVAAALGAVVTYLFRGMLDSIKGNS